MTETERKQARNYVKLQEDLKDPAVKQAYEYQKRRMIQEENRKKILDNWGPYGYVPPISQQASEKPSTQETRRDEILSYYS